MFADLRRALGLLTVLPVGAPAGDSVAPGRAMAYYPLVGAMIGAVLAGVAAFLRWIGIAESVPLLGAAVVLATWASLTGGLHLDGWADSCDALYVPVDRRRRLEIMADPHLGGFGAVGLVLLLLLKLAAIEGVLAGPHPLVALVGVAAMGRWAVVVAAYAYPSARPGGMGDSFRRGLTWWVLGIASVVALAAVVPLLLWGLVVWATAAIACIGMALVATSRLGGLTGDVYGAIVELAETLALVVLCFL